MPDAVMIFAAGRGTRMAPLTDRIPKPLVRLAGKTLLDHALDIAAEAAPRQVVVNTHYLADQIETHLSTRPAIRISKEKGALLETGGGLRAALPLLGPGPVFTLNSDAAWSDRAALTELRKAWRPEEMDALLLLVPTERAHGFGKPGDFHQDADGRLHRGGDLVYTGAQIVKPEGLHEIQEHVFSLNVLWNRMAEAGRLYGTVYSGHWADVGTPEGITVAETMLDQVG